MARLASIIKNDNKKNSPIQHRNRCSICGRPRATIRRFGICRICFRNMALSGKLPGVTKSSW